jgi:hypothetical protein
MRLGRARAALPSDPGLDELLADTRLSATAKLIAVTLVKTWAWSKPACWPSDSTIAAKVGRSRGTVQRGLKELEGAGYLGRERDAEVRGTKRRLWLLWRCPGRRAGATGGVAPARQAVASPARHERVVVERKGVEQDVRPAPERQRPGPPATTPVNPTAAALNRVTQDAVTGPQAAPSPEESPTIIPTPAASPRAQEMPSWPREAGRAGTAATPGPVHRVSRAPSSSPPSAPPTPPPKGSPLAGLTPEEQARFCELPEATRWRVATWLGLGDPICLGEAKKLLVPRPPREPPPSSLATAELLAGLPGRPDRVAAAAGRLVEDLRDSKSYNFYVSVAGAVCARRQPAETLVSAWRQGTSPNATRPGAVFAAAWKREVRSPT